jgi:RNA polymerase sigma factor (sigma-70 family)
LSIPETDDIELLKKFRDESSRNLAFEQIVLKYQKKLYWLVRKIVIDHDDTDDILQNTFIKVWDNLANFREDARLYTWLYRVATNEALTFLKKKRVRYMIPMVDVEHELAGKLSSDPYFSGNKLQMQLQKAVLTLPEKQRVVFNMKYFEEMKYEDMSEVLGTSVGALKASYHHAVKKVEKYFEKD